MADTDTATLDAFARKGMAAQNAVDRLTAQPLMLDLNAVPKPASDVATDRARDRSQLLQEASRLTRRATELRAQAKKLAAEIVELQTQAARDRETPQLPFDQAARDVADAILPKPKPEPDNPPLPGGLLEAAIEQIANETAEETAVRDAEKEVAIAGLQQAYTSPAYEPLHKLNVLPPAEPAEEGVTSPTTLPVGHVWTVEQLPDLKAEDLEEAAVGFHLWPAAPKFETDGCGVIGKPLKVANDHWAVIGACNHNNKGTTENRVRYTLVPLHTEDEWGGKVARWPDRWREHSGPPDTCDCTGVLATDPWGHTWILGFMSEAVYIDAPRKETAPAPAPATNADLLEYMAEAVYVDAPAPAAVPAAEEMLEMLPAGTDLADVEFHRAWYAHECRQRQIEMPAPLNASRLRTLLETPPEFRHLMLDPRLNDHGVRQNPTVIHVDTIPKAVGEAHVNLFDDLDGKWWWATSIEFKKGLGGSSSPCQMPRSEDQRAPTKLEALNRGLAELLERAMHRHATPSEVRGPLSRFTDAIIQFRKRVEQKAKESTGGKHVKPKKAKGLAGRRSVDGGGNAKDSFAAWYAHFNHTFKGLAHFDAPHDDDEVCELYVRYLDLKEGLSPSDAAREYFNKNFRDHPEKITRKGAEKLVHSSHKKPTKAKGAKADKYTVSLGSYVGGLKQSLKDAPKLLAKINYDPKAKTAHPLVEVCWKNGIGVREAAAKFREDGI